MIDPTSFTYDKKAAEERAKKLHADANRRLNKLKTEVKEVLEKQNLNKDSYECQLYSDTVFDLQDGSQLHQVNTPKTRLYYVEKVDSFVFLSRSNLDDNSGVCYSVRRLQDDKLSIKILQH
ncbi:unnamed protein product [Bursaphelenchus okinawaensis]|uniref:Uncharacterized protein n=1 Tax=Bursaphelenchus okinawaensis TaxID=465554 RepID=A0A811LA77_9BILA|nr:unnamed protein product [Bursaphelenchus okinawaensis]CAG9120445.1 unnamed protein product [Bursaphelenchus okinawaensis]